MKIYHCSEGRLILSPLDVKRLDGQGHAARALWNLLHEWWTWSDGRRRPSKAQAENAIRQARREIPWFAELPAQAALRVLKDYIRAWQNHWAGRSRHPKFKIGDFLSSGPNCTAESR